MLTLEEAALDYFGHGWLDPLDAARELTNLARHGCDWPKAPMSEWLDVIDRLIESGQLRKRGDGAVMITVEVAEPVAVRMDLFG